VTVGSAAVVVLIITLVSCLHLCFWSSLGDIVIVILVFCIVILVHILRDGTEKFSQECPELRYAFA
jgi:Flp pilus assembly protein TadB